MWSRQAAAWIEKSFRPGSREFFTRWPADNRGLASGSKVLVVGGGIAGSAFARQLLLESWHMGKAIDVYMVNSSSCNYCGGLVTTLAERTLENFYHLNVPADLVLTRVDACVYLNAAGATTVALPRELTALLRTSRFGLEGFDDSIKDRIAEGLPAEVRERFHLMEPTLVRHIEVPGDATQPWRLTLSKKNSNGQPIELAGDVLVLATGFKSLGRPMIDGFQAATGYQPPETIPASVTEIDTSRATKNEIGRAMYIIDGVFPGAVLAFIPKGRAWLTLTAMGKTLTREDLDMVFAHPVVRQFIELPDARESTRCHTVCPARIFAGTARHFYGDRWVAVGDLTGYGRVLKDGYYGAFVTGFLAAKTMLTAGTGKTDFARYYHKPLEHYRGDNQVGMLLFRLNARLNQVPWFGRFFIAASKHEIRSNDAGGFVHAAIRALATGELSYRWITWLFTRGLLGFLFAHPVQAGKAILRRERKPGASNTGSSLPG